MSPRADCGCAKKPTDPLPTYNAMSPVDSTSIPAKQSSELVHVVLFVHRQVCLQLVNLFLEYVDNIREVDAKR